MEFDTKRLEIKKFIPEYISVLYNSLVNRDVLRYVEDINPGWNLEEFTEYIVDLYQDENYQRSLIKLKSENKIIGTILLFREDKRSKSIKILIDADYWNKGYGKEALAGATEFLKAEGIGSIYATCDSRNISARKMLDGNKYENIDSIPEFTKDVDGNIGDELLYELEIIRVSY